jgi:hypothetical protein
MALQSARSPNFENFKIPNLGVPRQNDTWMQPLWLITKNTKGEGGGFPQVRVMVSLKPISYAPLLY